MKSVKAKGRVEVPVEVLELARWDFSVERISNNQVCVLRACNWIAAVFNNPSLPSWTLQTICSKNTLK